VITSVFQRAPLLTTVRWHRGDFFAFNLSPVSLLTSHWKSPAVSLAFPYGSVKYGLKARRKREAGKSALPPYFAGASFLDRKEASSVALRKGIKIQGSDRFLY